MELIIIIIFVIGYIAIAFEDVLKVNKTATALLTGVLCWMLFILSEPTPAVLNSEEFQAHAAALSPESNAIEDPVQLYHDFVTTSLSSHLGAIAEILFFLMGAMTIVELIDAHDGFRIITDKIKTRSPKTLMWIVCFVTFFLSAILDNLTTVIVMVSLIRKLVPNREMRLLFIGMIVISANAGGAWTPMGDVTTTMLWIGGQVSTGNIMRELLIPSLVCMIIPLLYLSRTMKGEIELQQNMQPQSKGNVTGRLMLVLGISVMLGVPVFKILTHLPPYAGMMGGLGLLWVVSEIINPEVDESLKKYYSPAGALSRIDTPSILFFLGILLAVSALESMMTLQHFSSYLNDAIGDHRIIISLTGILSAIVDNVPLVAAAIGMYPIEVYPQDHFIWQYLAYCAGTGGSILIIGSAAGVAAMGMERINFIWYMKKISFLALAGYVGGALIFLLMNGYL
jgi:Na+/H+ antiporter NhaD/arsenite permease-like protein